MAIGLIDEIFTAKKKSGTGALLPFVTAGYPDSETVKELIKRADSLGVACLEIGFPFSDSIADGPVIQDSFHQALSNGWRICDTFDLVSDVRAKINCALVAMVSFSIVYRQGVDTFMKRAADVGFDGVILPDVPLEETAPLRSAAQETGLAYVGLIAPGSTKERRSAIARQSSGFIYQMAVAGITGERRALPPQLSNEIAQLRSECGLPICVGFGISTPDHVRTVCSVADGAIVGSAIIRRIRDGIERGSPPESLVESVSAFVSDLMRGTESSGS